MSGLREDPQLAHCFRVELDLQRTGILGLQIVANCSECSGLNSEITTFEYQEGGLNEFTHRLRGPAKYSNLILKRGLMASDELWNWHQEAINGRVLRKSGAIYLLDTAGYEKIRWDFFDAFPVKWTGPTLNAATAAMAFESVELVHRGLSLTVLD